jgi:hypothetical protein
MGRNLVARGSRGLLAALASRGPLAGVRSHELRAVRASRGPTAALASRGLPAALVLCLCLAGTASAQQSVALQATLTPEQLGHSTTIGFSFQIDAPAGRVPSPVSAIEVFYPVDLAFALSELGLASCPLEALEASGPEGCPVNSRMGYGTALAEIPIGPSILREAASVTIFRTASENGHLALLFLAEGGNPVDADIAFTGLLLPAAAPFGGALGLDVPPIPSIPGAPDVALVQLHSTLGPEHLTYQERVHGRTVDYQPKGIPLPESCPRGGFRFAARFSFQDGTDSSAESTVPCPAEGPPRPRTR